MRDGLTVHVVRTRMRSCCIGVLLAAAVACLSAAPARAIIGGQFDGSGHPFVAAIGQPDGGGIYFTGTAISPNVVLTAAHAVLIQERLDGMNTARVTFDPVASASSTWYSGTMYVDPAFDPTSLVDRNDLAVIVLDTQIKGIAPASLPTEGLLDQLTLQGPRASFELVGYGISNYVGGANGGGHPTLDFGSTGTRNLAEENLGSVTSGWLRLQVDGGASVCIGDSGAPSFIGGSDVVAGITIGGQSINGGQCQSPPWDQRVDTPSARAFLGAYGVTLP